MDAEFHYPPELLQLLIDTIPLLCPRKLDVIQFFQGAGVAERHLVSISAQLKADTRSISKYQMTRHVLGSVNKDGDASLRARREIIRRVTEFEAFDSCWPDDQLKAKGLVGEVRRVVLVKDTFTRINDLREQERRTHSEKYAREAAERARRREELEQFKQQFFGLFAITDPVRRGHLLEPALNDLFAFAGIQVRESFRRISESDKTVEEQIDGVVELDGEIYLVEMKWLSGPVDINAVSRHLVRVYHRGSARGILVSATEFTSAALQTCRDALQQTVIVLCTLEEIVQILQMDGDLQELLKAKIRAAIVDKEPYRRIAATKPR